MKKTPFIVITLVTLLLVGAGATWKYSKSTTCQLFGEIVDRVETDELVVALTFDDGPTSGYTQRVLEILDLEQVRATFFLNGRSMSDNPAETRLIVDAGHEIGNHSFSHKRMIFKSYGFVADELERTDQLIREAGYRGPIHFRPPYGKKLFNLPRYLDNNDTVSITWDVAAESYGEDSTDAAGLVQRVLQQVRPGSIVLLHVMFDSRESSMQALPDIIGGLKDRDYRFLTVSELLDYRAE
jgi:peptidoglycan/xylan/chitin deacetylase (PgdA/CDA1 family)